MRALLLPALALLALPALPMTAAPEHLAEVELSHGFFTPYMHLAALNIPEGIRPGSWLVIGAANCTASFVLRDAGGYLYITTAGHCTDEVGQRAAIKQGTLVAGAGIVEEFGTVVAHWPDDLDAALIAIDHDKYSMVNPTMTGWGGPTGLFTGQPEEGLQTLHHGWGWVTWYEMQTRCRRGLADVDRWNDRVWWSNEVGGGGDSGSAILTSDGRALGILDWGGGVVVPTLVTGAFVSNMVGGVRMDAVLDAWNADGWELTLVKGGPLNPVCVPEPSVCAPHDAFREPRGGRTPHGHARLGGGAHPPPPAVGLLPLRPGQGPVTGDAPGYQHVPSAYRGRATRR